MSWSGYFGIENIALTAPQKATLVAALQALGPSDDPQPAELIHSRTRLDNDAVIFRARFQDGALTVANLRQFLAATFGVPVAHVSAATTQQTFAVRPSPIVTLSYQATPRLRVALFGGTTATTAESNSEVLAYLAANAAAWGDA